MLEDQKDRARDRVSSGVQPRPITYSQRPKPQLLNDFAVPTQKATPKPAPKPVLAVAPTPPAGPVEKIPTMPVPAQAGAGGLVNLAQSHETSAKKGRRTNSRKLSMALTVLAVIAFGTGIFVGVNSLRTNRYVNAQIANLRKSNDPNAPAEDQPTSDDLHNYKVPDAEPRLLSISKIGVTARIRKLGVKNDNELAAPSNIYDAGWYDGSSLPGEPGAMLLDGHVQGPTKPGIFKELDKLSAGDKLSIERGDGKTYNFHVVKAQTYDSTSLDMRDTLNSVDQNKNGLNIITCTGQYDTKTKNYNKRLVVFAVQD